MQSVLASSLTKLRIADISNILINHSVFISDIYPIILCFIIIQALFVVESSFILEIWQEIEHDTLNLIVI